MASDTTEQHTREQYLAQTKSKALHYLIEGDLTKAYSTMATELLQRHDTAAGWNVTISALGMRYVQDGNDRGVRRWIEGFK